MSWIIIVTIFVAICVPIFCAWLKGRLAVSVQIKVDKIREDLHKKQRLTIFEEFKKAHLDIFSYFKGNVENCTCDIQFCLQNKCIKGLGSVVFVPTKLQTYFEYNNLIRVNNKGNYMLVDDFREWLLEQK